MTQIIAQGQNLNQLAENIVIFCDQNKSLLANATLLDNQLDNDISTYLEYTDFSAKQGKVTKFNSIKNNRLVNIFIVSLGEVSNAKQLDCHKIGLKLSAFLKKEKVKIASLINEKSLGEAELEDLISAILWFNYSFTEWKTKPESNELLELSIQTTDDVNKLNSRISELEELNKSINLARDLINRPANVVTPEYLAEEAKQLKEFGVKTTVIDAKKMEKLGLNLIHHVGKGSINEPKIVIMEYYGLGKSAENFALVGKGVTFDSGGYNIKPGDAMRTMKTDMGGAAATIGTIRALATSKTPINVIGVMACAENMISEKAYKVDDVIKSYNGLTVENKNTDAEGRLVLADAISYTLKNYEIAEVIDIATLTGAAVVALGAEYAAVMGKNQEVIDCLIEASKQSNEQIWQMPMGKAYAETLKSEIADTSNLGSRYGGTISAGEFINKFTEQKPWAHLDIAGVAFVDDVPGTLQTLGIKGATGFGVKLLTTYYKNKAN